MEVVINELINVLKLIYDGIIRLKFTLVLTLIKNVVADGRVSYDESYDAYGLIINDALKLIKLLLSKRTISLHVKCPRTRFIQITSRSNGKLLTSRTARSKRKQCRIIKIS